MMFRFFRLCHVGFRLCHVARLLCVFVVVVNCVSIFWVVQIFPWMFVDCFKVCLGCFGPPWDVLVVLGCLVSRSDELTLSMQFPVVMNCLGCFRLCLVMLGCVRLP